MGLAEDLLAKVAGYGPRMIEVMERLVAAPGLGPDNGGQGEMEKSRVLLPYLEAMGLELEHLDSPDPRVACGLRPNILASLPGGPGPAVWVLAHLDVVPPGDLALWSGDPSRLRVEGDKLYGRGVDDNHHGLVSGLFALQALGDLGITPPGRVGLVLVADEETGSGHGLAHVLAARPQAFAPRDLIVVPDAGQADGGLIEVAEKSIYWLKVEVTGRQVHASTPHKGVNALYAAARMMVATRELAGRFSVENPLFDPPRTTMEPTRKDQGVQNINTIPGSDVFYVDCRVLPGIPLEDVRRALEQCYGEIAAQEGATVAMSEVQRLQAPAATPAEAPVVKALQAAIARVHGVEARPGGIGGGTVAAFFRQQGLPVAVWCSDQGTAHMPDEWTSLAAIIRDAQVFALVMAGLA